MKCCLCASDRGIQPEEIELPTRQQSENVPGENTDSKVPGHSRSSIEQKYRYKGTPAETRKSSFDDIKWIHASKRELLDRYKNFEDERELSKNNIKIIHDFIEEQIGSHEASNDMSSIKSDFERVVIGYTQSCNDIEKPNLELLGGEGKITQILKEPSDRQLEDNMVEIRKIREGQNESLGKRQVEHGLT